MCDGISGLAIIDVDDPNSPLYIYQSDIQTGDAQGIAINQLYWKKYLSLAIGSEGVLFYYLSNPSKPSLSGQPETSYAFSVDIFRGWVYYL